MLLLWWCASIRNMYYSPWEIFNRMYNSLYRNDVHFISVFNECPVLPENAFCEWIITVSRRTANNWASWIQHYSIAFCHCSSGDTIYSIRNKPLGIKFVTYFVIFKFEFNFSIIRRRCVIILYHKWMTYNVS